MRPDLNLLYALEALLDEGSVVAAARRMHLSAPAMSRTLARIRETTGDPIFVQSGRQLVPTPRARAAPADQGCAPGRRRPAGAGEQVDLELLDARFNVRANDIFIGIHAGRLLDAMQQAMPRATLCFVPEEDDLDDDALRSGRVDLFISASRPLGHEIRVQPLFSIRVVGVAREDHPCSRTRSRRAAWRWGHIGVSRRGKTQGPIDDALARLGLDRHVALVVPTASSALLALQTPT